MDNTAHVTISGLDMDATCDIDNLYYFDRHFTFINHYNSETSHLYFIEIHELLFFQGYFIDAVNTDEIFLGYDKTV